MNCSNHGLCQYGGNNTFICVCESNYEGKQCQQFMSPCSHHPCLNNATCYDENLTDFKCECQANYYGKNCENKIDICQNTTCSNNGYCKDVNNQPKCICFSMFSGDSCQNIDSRQKTARAIISTATVIAIASIFIFYGLVILNDLSNFCCRKPKKLKNPIKKEEPISFVYVP